MKHEQEFYYNGIHFMYVAGCGLQMIEEDGTASYVENSEEKKVRKEAEALIELGNIADFDLI